MPGQPGFLYTLHVTNDFDGDLPIARVRMTRLLKSRYLNKRNRGDFFDGAAHHFDRSIQRLIDRYLHREWLSEEEDGSIDDGLQLLERYIYVMTEDFAQR